MHCLMQILHSLGGTEHIEKLPNILFLLLLYPVYIFVQLTMWGSNMHGEL